MNHAVHYLNLIISKVPGTDIWLRENFEYIWCIAVNTRILSVPENFENVQHIW